MNSILQCDYEMDFIIEILSVVFILFPLAVKLHTSICSQKAYKFFFAGFTCTCFIILNIYMVYNFFYSQLKSLYEVNAKEILLEYLLFVLHQGDINEAKHVFTVHVWTYLINSYVRDYTLYIYWYYYTRFSMECPFFLWCHKKSYIKDKNKNLWIILLDNFVFVHKTFFTFFFIIYCVYKSVKFF